MKKNNFIKKIFLLILVASFASANFFALAVDSSVNFKSSSSNYEFNAEVGAPAVGRSVSSNYILDHGAYWEEYSAPVENTFDGNGEGGSGGGEQISYNNPIFISTPVSTSSKSENKITIEYVKKNCNSVISCSSIAIVREIEMINQHQSNLFVVSNNNLKISKNLIYSLIGILLILIIIFLVLDFKKIKDRANESDIESKNK